MRVTPEMTTEGGTSLAKLADFLGTDRKTGIQVKADPGEVRIVIDSMAWPSESIDMDPDDIDEFIELLRKRQAEARQ